MVRFTIVKKGILVYKIFRINKIKIYKKVLTMITVII